VSIRELRRKRAASNNKIEGRVPVEKALERKKNRKELD
jgi:hypothetical protein